MGGKYQLIQWLQTAVAGKPKFPPIKQFLIGKDIFRERFLAIKEARRGEFAMKQNCTECKGFIKKFTQI